MQGELRKLRKMLRLVVAEVGLCAAEVHTLLHNEGKDRGERERLRRLREVTVGLACRVREFAGVVEELAAGPQPSSAEVGQCFEPVLVCLADILTGACEQLTVDDSQWFSQQVNELWDEALRSNVEAGGEGAGS